MGILHCGLVYVSFIFRAHIYTEIKYLFKCVFSGQSAYQDVVERTNDEALILDYIKQKMTKYIREAVQGLGEAEKNG